ncbi:hypothetical protein [Falsiroseomonas sp.]|uniref:phage head spike fiber domain-containing protein n=1 Tax=Falsiroseomonas sp. TaxID=2870721 RepID=UPI00271FDC47|nr:hypothetical protein [Falsiroseomonas sp.]MDO9502633.1 hypothetical protein [Falsiroseomonas sp.]
MTMAMAYVPGMLGDIGTRLTGPSFLRGLATLQRAQVTSQVTALAADGQAWVEYGTDVPRFHGPARRLLIEGQRTNLVANTRTPGGTGWGTSGCASVAGVAGPDGNASSAARITEDTSVGQHAVSSTISGVTAGTEYTQSCFFRSVSGSQYVQMSGSNATGLTFHANFDLLAGTVTAATDCIAQIAPMGAGWFRGSITLIAPGTGNGVFRISTADSPTAARLASHGGTGKTYDVAWPQLEAGSFASTTVLPPTATPAASTRGADLVSAPLASMGIGGTGACTVLWSGMMPQLAGPSFSQEVFDIDGGSIGNRYSLRLPAGGSASVTLLNLTGGVSGGAQTVGSIAAGTPFRVGMSIDGTGRAAVSLNGAAAGAASGGPTSGMTTLRIGNNASGSAPMFGEVGTIIVMPFALSDADLAARVAAFPAA